MFSFILQLTSGSNVSLRNRKNDAIIAINKNIPPEYLPQITHFEYAGTDTTPPSAIAVFTDYLTALQGAVNLSEVTINVRTSSQHATLYNFDFLSHLGPNITTITIDASVKLETKKFVATLKALPSLQELYLAQTLFINVLPEDKSYFVDLQERGILKDYGTAFDNLFEQPTPTSAVKNPQVPQYISGKEFLAQKMAELKLKKGASSGSSSSKTSPSVMDKKEDKRGFGAGAS